MQPEKYYHSRLILYFPWRNEEQLLGTFDTYQQHYMSVCNLVEDNGHEFNLHSNEMDAAIDNLAKNGPPKITWEAIVPTTEEDNLNVQNEDHVNVGNLDSDDEDIDSVNDLDVEEILNSNENRSDPSEWPTILSMLYSRQARKYIMSSDDYCQHISYLNYRQRHRLFCITGHGVRLQSASSCDEHINFEKKINNAG